MRNFLNRVGFGVLSFVAVPLTASAVTDITAVTAAFADAATGVGAIAAVMLAVVAAGIAVKWLLGFVIG